MKHAHFRHIFFPLLLVASSLYAMYYHFLGCTSFETALMLLGLSALSYITSVYTEERPIVSDMAYYFTYTCGIAFFTFVLFFWK